MQEDLFPHQGRAKQSEEVASSGVQPQLIKSRALTKLENTDIPESIIECKDLHCNHNNHKEDIDKYVIDISLWFIIVNFEVSTQVVYDNMYHCISLPSLNCNFSYLITSL